MFKFKTFATTITAVLMLSAGAAQAELKIAVLDTQRAIFETESVKSRLETVNQELQKDQEEAQGLQSKIQAAQEKLQKDADVMSDEDKRRSAKDIEDMQLDLQFLVNKLQKEVKDRREDLMRDMVPKIDAVLKDLIELEGYDLIAERSSFHYVNPKHDITRRVTEKLNEKAAR